MHDRLAPAERQQQQQEIVGRFQTSWSLVDQGVESGYGTNLNAVSRIFLRSIFAPQSIPKAERFPSKVNRTFIEKLRGFSPFQSVTPSEQQIQDAERTLVQRILDVQPPLVAGAKETVRELTQIGRFNIWTVGDHKETRHSLPEELVGKKDTLPGTGHQYWKMVKSGFDKEPGVNLLVSDNKLDQLMGEIIQQEKAGVKRITIMDDSFGNLEKAKAIIDQENMDRELVGEQPIVCDYIFVNQGRKRVVPPPALGGANSTEKGTRLKGAYGTFSVVDAFSETPTLLKDLHADLASSDIGIFCDFDGVITDNAAMRKEWDAIALSTVQEVISRSQLKNPQKELRGGQITKEDLTPAALQSFVEACRAKGLRIGVKNGAYDIIQPGHVAGFDDAHDACDILIVMLNSDASIKKYKGEKENVPRPIVTETQRADVLLGLDAVDAVVLYDEPDPAAIIRLLKPDVYISSAEYQGKPLPEFKAAGEVGADIVYTDIRKGFSSSSIVRDLLQGFLGVMRGKGTEAQRASDVLKKLAGYA